MFFLKAGKNKNIINFVVIIVIIIVIFVVYSTLNKKNGGLGDSLEQSSKVLSPAAVAFQKIKILYANFFSNSKFNSLKEVIIKSPKLEIGKKNPFKFNKPAENNLNSNEQTK